MNKKMNKQSLTINFIFYTFRYMNLFGHPETIRTLGLCQPYASLMLTDNKLETRWVKQGNKPPFPLGKYLIYSTKKMYTQLEVDHISGAYLTRPWTQELEFQIRGQALFIADLISVRDMRPEDSSTAFVNYLVTRTHRLVCLEFLSRRRIKSFPFRGKQGVGFLTDDDIAKIEYIDEI